MDSVTYHSSIKHTPKQRLQRIVSGLLFEMQQDRPLLSTEEARMWLGLALCRNRNNLINQTLVSLEQGR